jgi:endo-1,3-1,4-beta-glycanase ExoK
MEQAMINPSRCVRSNLLLFICAFTLSMGAAPFAAKAEQLPFFLPYPHLDLGRWYVSDGWVNGEHQSCEWRKTAIQPVDGKIALLLSDDGGKLRPLGCAEMHTTARTSYGVYEARLRTAAGSGLNTAFFTYVGPPTGSPEHDEIDFEFLGKDPHTVSITHYTNGKSTKGEVVNLGFDASKEFHNYSIEWSSHKIRWFVDGKVVHETAAQDPIPRNATRIYLSLWSGSAMEDAWLGPFKYTEPVSAEVEWAKFTPLNP